jgi:hypothetical protein
MEENKDGTKRIRILRPDSQIVPLVQAVVGTPRFQHLRAPDAVLKSHMLPLLDVKDLTNFQAVSRSAYHQTRQYIEQPTAHGSRDWPALSPPPCDGPTQRPWPWKNLFHVQRLCGMYEHLGWTVERDFEVEKRIDYNAFGIAMFRPENIQAHPARCAIWIEELIQRTKKRIIDQMKDGAKLLTAFWSVHPIQSILFIFPSDLQLSEEQNRIWKTAGAKFDAWLSTLPTV